MTNSPSVQRPDPIVERDNAFFWEAAKEERLVARSCGECGDLVNPPVPMCPACNSLSWTVTPLSGRGTITEWMCVHYPPTPFFDYPVLVITVRLEEGIELITNLVDNHGCQLKDGAEHGQSVEVAFAPTVGGWKVPVFKLAAIPARSEI